MGNRRGSPAFDQLGPGDIKCHHDFRSDRRGCRRDGHSRERLEQVSGSDALYRKGHCLQGLLSMSLERWLLGFTDEQGLTLVELLIALTILSVGILGAVGMFPVAYQHLRAGGDLTKATALAQRMVELLRDEPLQLVPRYHNADTRDTASFPADDPGGTPPFRGGSASALARGDSHSASRERLISGLGPHPGSAARSRVVDDHGHSRLVGQSHRPSRAAHNSCWTILRG